MKIDIQPRELQELDLYEFEELCRPIVEYIQKKWHPHTRIIIDWETKLFIKI